MNLKCEECGRSDVGLRLKSRFLVFGVRAVCDKCLDEEERGRSLFWIFIFIVMGAVWAFS